jgi:uncharacterized membrane protein
MGENHFAALPTAAYGVVMVGSALAYTILQASIVREEGPDSKLAAAVGKDRKGKLSLAMYVAAIPLAFVNEFMSDALYVAVALIWFLPDRRIEKTIER